MKPACPVHPTCRHVNGMVLSFFFLLFPHIKITQAHNLVNASEAFLSPFGSRGTYLGMWDDSLAVEEISVLLKRRLYCAFCGFLVSARWEKAPLPMSEQFLTASQKWGREGGLNNLCRDPHNWSVP